MKIIDYDIITCTYQNGFTDEVKKFLMEGWCLYGYPYYADEWYCQAIVKYEAVLACDEPHDWKIKDLYLRIEALEKLVASQIPKITFEDLKSSNWEEK